MFTKKQLFTLAKGIEKIAAGLVEVAGPLREISALDEEPIATAPPMPKVLPQTVKTVTLKKPETPATEEKEEHTSSRSSAVAVAPKEVKTDLDNASRGELKTIAEGLGINTAGKRASELRAMIMEAQKVAKPTPTKPKLVPSVPVVKEYSILTMRDDLETFIEMNRPALEKADFFSETPTGDPNNPTYAEIFASEALIKAAWEDNIKELVESGQWNKLVEEFNS